MSKFLIVLLIIGGVFIFVLGGGVGVFYQTQQAQQNVQPNNEVELALTKILTSKIIPSITAFGEVAKIDGRNITLKYLGDDLTIVIDNNAQIFSLTTVSPSGKSTVAIPTQKTAEFKDIKIGDKLNVNLNFLPNGVLKGMSVIIINLLTSATVNTK